MDGAFERTDTTALADAEAVSWAPAPRRRARNRRRWLGVVVVAGGLTLLSWPRTWPDLPAGLLPHRSAAPAAQKPVQSVRTAEAAAGDVVITRQGLGTVVPLATVTVKPQIGGPLIDIGFKEGQEVRKGDFLAQIDPRPYEIALHQAEGQMAHDQALLKAAQIDLARYQKLKDQDSIAKQQVDTQLYLSYQYQGTVQADQAAIDNAKLNLTYCHIVAPIDGRVGLRQIDAGNYVQTADPAGIVVITQLRPITVTFTLAEDELPRIMRRLASGAELPVLAYDRTDSRVIATGTLDSVDNQIDVTTGTVKLRARFSNDDDALFPNQFVNAHLLIETLPGVTTVPSAAVQSGAPGTFVWLIGADDTVSVRRIEAGPVDGERTAALAGLAPGDRVVIDGTDRLREGAAVRLADAGSSPDPIGAAATPAAAPAATGAPQAAASTRHRHEHVSP